jgi:hypothetical protein
MFCPSCGQNVVDGIRFCGHCGRQLTAAKPAVPTRRRGYVAVTIYLLIVILIIGAGWMLLRRWNGIAVSRQPDAVALATRQQGPDLFAESVMITPTGEETAVFTVTAMPLPTLTPSATATATAFPTATTMPLASATATPSVIPTVNTPGAITTTPVVSEEVVAVFWAMPPTIDGWLLEWSGSPGYLSAHRVHAIASRQNGQDITAVWQLAWDENNLYIGVDVADDVHVQTQTGNQTFRGDSLEMQIDIGRDQGLLATRLSPEHFQLIFSPGNFNDIPPSAIRFRGNDLGQMRDVPEHNIRVAAQQLPTGYTLEAAIPWSDLAVIPQPGLVLGLALNANDNDTPGTAVQEVMVSNVPGRLFADPSSWGTLELGTGVATMGVVPLLQRNLYLTTPFLRGEDVSVVQQKLFDLGYTQVGEIDGIFGPLTDGAVKAFQSDEGLLVDGVVGPITWSRLFELTD